MIRVRSLWAVCLLLPALSFPSRAAVLYVNQSAPGPTHDGASWTTACLTVQQGINGAVAGDEVWVAAGTYKENVTLPSGVGLFGGFCGTETARSQSNPVKYVTVLDGAGKGRVLYMPAGTAVGVPRTLDGFTVRNGVFGSGAGMYIVGDAVISNNVIVDNACVSGGLGSGGGICAGGGTITIANDLIAGNTADQGGGILYGGGKITVANCTIVGNTALDGGAIYNQSTGTLVVVNSLITVNSSGVYRFDGAVSLNHCDVFGNTAYNFSGLTDPTGTSGNMSVDPELSPFATGCHLQPGSPCIDAGDDSAVTAGETDLYGKPRIIGAHVDIGADESDGTAYPNPPSRVWRVSTTGSDANDGSSWSKARASLGLTLMYAQPGDEVWVAQGTYQGPNYLPSGVGLYGGFAGTETARTQRNPATNITTLDGVVYTFNSTPYAWTVVSIAPDATSDTVVDGFTIQNGDGRDGSGINIGGGSPVISNNVFLSNGRSSLQYQTKVVINGGGIYVAGGSPTITGNSFAGDLSSGNGATNGAGIYVADGTSVIMNNSFSGCNARVGAGGGICVGGGVPLISGNTFTGCQGVFGGGVCAESGLIRDSVFLQCNAGPDTNGVGAGGGIYVGPAAVADHNRLIGNVSDNTDPGGGGAAVEGTFIDNDLEDNVGRWGSALVTIGTGFASQNKITSTSTAISICQIWSYGGTLSNNLIVSRSGGGVILGSFTALEAVTNNTFVNTGPLTGLMADSCGLASALGQGEQPVVSNNIVTGYAHFSGTGGIGETPPVVTLANNDAFGNTDNTLNLPGTQSGNISADPMFVDPTNGDYRLKAGSPCIDAGSDAYVNSGDRDLAGAPRVYGAHVDIGAYEYGSPVWTLADAAEVLRIAGGLSISTPAEAARLNLASDASALTLTDATRIAQWLMG